jgi:hypothetical protein
MERCMLPCRNFTVSAYFVNGILFRAEKCCHTIYVGCKTFRSPFVFLLLFLYMILIYLSAIEHSASTLGIVTLIASDYDMIYIFVNCNWVATWWQ